MASLFRRGGEKTKVHYYASCIGRNSKQSTKCTFTTDKVMAECIARKYEGNAALWRDGGHS